MNALMLAVFWSGAAIMWGTRNDITTDRARAAGALSGLLDSVKVQAAVTALDETSKLRKLNRYGPYFLVGMVALASLPLMWGLFSRSNTLPEALTLLETDVQTDDSTMDEELLGKAS
jgi:hypothetical protein